MYSIKLLPLLFQIIKSYTLNLEGGGNMEKLCKG